MRNAWPNAMTGSLGCHASFVNVWVTYEPVSLSNNCTCSPSAVGRPSMVVTPPSTGVSALRNAAVAGMAEARSPCNATPKYSTVICPSPALSSTAPSPGSSVIAGLPHTPPSSTFTTNSPVASSSLARLLPSGSEANKFATVLPSSRSSGLAMSDVPLGYVTRTNPIAFFEYFSVFSSARKNSVFNPPGRLTTLLFSPEALNISSALPAFVSSFQFRRSPEYSNALVVQRCPRT